MASWVSLSSQAIDGWPSRVFQPKQLSAFVKGFPCRIVSGRAKEPAVTAWFLIIQMGMATRNDQDHTGQRKCWVLQPGGGDVAFKMAYADHWNIQGIGQCFCIIDPDE